ncbi:MAG: hypothetical protein GX625_08360 [Clostridiaceae bacterium]|nr:hypothetical protein [Clostridiaceae bacterium]HPD01318.1 hypothetical protein [Acetivibrio sp.]
MKDKKAESLKKRIFGDMICSFAIAAVSIYVFITEMWTYFSTDRTYPKHITFGLYALFVFGFTLITGLILLEIRKTGKPFSQKIINKLRVLAVLVIVAGLIPDAVTPIIDDMLNGSATQVAYKLVFSEKNIIIAIVGVVIGIVSEMFVYGYELQDDIDSIA